MTKDISHILYRTKIFAHPDRLAEWLATGITRPISAQIDPSNRCNYDCNQCAGLRIDRNAELSMEDMRHIIDQISPYVRGIEFTGGGEPLINKHVPDAIIYAKEKNIDVGVITHGHLLNENNIPKIISSSTFVRISLDAFDSAGHKTRKGTRDAQSFSKVTGNISALVKEKKRQQSNCTIGLSYLTDFGDDIESLKKFVELSKSLGADYAQFRPYHHSIRDFSPDIEKLSHLNSDTFTIIYSKDKYAKEKFDYKQAFADEFRTVIAATGEMYPDCFTRGIKNFSFGNILTTDFEKIWTSDNRREICEKKLSQTNCPKSCYYDPLNQALWEIYNAKKDVAHKNFV